MPETPIFRIPTPDGSESNDIEAHLLALAQRIEAQMDVLHPVGICYPYLFEASQAPSGFLFLRGQVMQRTAIPRLATLLGGSGPTVTLPDLRSMTLRGGEGNAVGQLVGADAVAIAKPNLPAYNLDTTIDLKDDLHDHNFVDSNFVINPQGGDHQHYIPAKYGAQPPQGQGWAHVTFSDTPATDANIRLAVTVGSGGSDQPLTTIPRSRVVNWITRAA